MLTRRAGCIRGHTAGGAVHRACVRSGVPWQGVLWQVLVAGCHAAHPCGRGKLCVAVTACLPDPVPLHHNSHTSCLLLPVPDPFRGCSLLGPSLQTLADKGLAEMVHPPSITFRDFEKVLLRARPTVSPSDLAVYEKFTSEFGEEG